ncbi:MAG TPA: MlaD family protein [Capillimicrobium sp.]|nr:MlaD family protein [Capillimicrobium sp.]
MKRIAVILALLACAIVVAVVAVAASGDGDDDTYRVRAIFDSAFTLVPGEEVRVAGVTVGRIESLDVTPDRKAAVVLAIDKPGFGNFRQDAECIARPQSLIGEKFIECTPTQPRPEGTEPPPLLTKIESGEGEGQYLLPVSNTRRSVDIDLINNIMRLPERQRLSIIINELGTGLAGRGKELNEVIRRANPALMETDKVLAILKQQNQVLADLARDSDQVLAPLADRREDVADFISRSRDVAQATAARRAQLEANFERLPRFLSELRPTLQRLGGLSDQMTPVLTDLGAQADDINRLVRELGPLAQASRPAFASLGDAAVVGTEAMRDIRPLTRDVNALAASSAPLADDLEALLTSFRKTGGIERLMDYFFYQVAAINGFDTSGHYLRAGLIINTCSTYRAATAPAPECRANFIQGQDAATRGYAPEPSGSSAVESIPSAAGAQGDEPAGTGGDDTPLAMPSTVTPSDGDAGDDGDAAGASSGATGGRTDATGRLLDYLLGGGQ